MERNAMASPEQAEAHGMPVALLRAPICPQACRGTAAPVRPRAGDDPCAGGARRNYDARRGRPTPDRARPGYNPVTRAASLLSGRQARRGITIACNLTPAGLPGALGRWRGGEIRKSVTGRNSFILSVKGNCLFRVPPNRFLTKRNEPVDIDAGSLTDGAKDCPQDFRRCGH